MASSYFKLKIIKRKEKQNLDILKSEKLIIEKTLNKFSETCRVCLKEGNIPVFGNENNPDISENFKVMADIELCKGDEYPKYLCNACNSLLEAAVLFRETAKATDRLLHKKAEWCNLQSSQIKTANIELPLITLNDTESVNDKDFVDQNKAKSIAYKCSYCKLSFTTKSSLTAHSNSKHRNVRVQCNICKGLITPQLYERHLERHRSASHLICEICGKLFRKDNLIRHLQYHSFELPYQCQECPYRGRFKNSLQIHMRTHTGTKPFSCDKCNLRFLTRSNLNRHILRHGNEKRFKCDDCGRGFYTKPDLDVHFKSIHAGILDFECKICGNKYVNRKAVMKHELRVHKRAKMAKGRTPLYLLETYKKACEVAQ